MWKYIIALLIPIAAFGGGYYYGNQNVKVTEKTVTIQGDTKIVFKDRIVTKTIIRSPDGTVTETTKEEEISQETSSHTSSNMASTETSNTGNTKEKYRIGANYWSRSPSDFIQPGNWSDRIGVSGSRRIIGPVWLDVEGRFGTRERQVAVGVSVTW